MLKCFRLNQGLVLDHNMSDHGTKLSLSRPQRNFQGPLSKADSGFNCAKSLKCNPVTSSEGASSFIIYHGSRHFYRFFEDFGNGEKKQFGDFILQ